jgi:tRNA(fMet)-specific endonuclease VapC
MLDTDTVSFVLRGEGAAGATLTAHAPSVVCLSAISLSELRFGAARRHSKRLNRLIDTFVAAVDVLAFDARAATSFGRLCADLEGTGTPIGVLHTLIAAHAMSLNLTLVTNNTKHFARIKGLRTVNWLHEAQ